MKQSSRKNYSLRLDKSKKRTKKFTLFTFRFVGLFAFFLILSGFNPLKNIPGNKFPPDKKDTIFVYDTVVIYDTAYVYDTVYTEETNTSNINDTTYIIKKIRRKKIYIVKDSLPKILNKNTNKASYLHRFSITAHFSPIYPKPLFSANYIYSDILNKNTNSITPLLGYTAGVNLNFNKLNFELSTGINFTKINSSFNFLNTQYKIDTNYYYKYFTTSEMKIDTVLFLNLDTLIATGDSLWVNVLDTNYVAVLDSSLHAKQDTSDYLEQEKRINTFKYIEFPFIFSYNINKRAYSLSPEIGIIPGIIMYSQGKIVSLEDEKESKLINNETKLSRLIISIYAGLRFNYYLSKRFDFIIKTYYRQNINSIFDNYPLFFEYKILGLQFGIKYKFLYNINKHIKSK